MTDFTITKEREYDIVLSYDNKTGYHAPKCVHIH